MAPSRLQISDTQQSYISNTVTTSDLSSHFLNHPSPPHHHDTRSHRLWRRSRHWQRTLTSPYSYHSYLTTFKNTAAKFTSKGIDHIILLARNTQRLENEDAPFVSRASSSLKVDTLRLDLANLASIPSVLEQLDSLTQGEDIEVVFFNAARIKPSDVLGVSVEEIDEDFKVRSDLLYPQIRVMLIVIPDNKSSTLHRGAALHPQTASRGQSKRESQARALGNKQPFAVGSGAAAVVAVAGESVAAQHGAELEACVW